MDENTNELIKTLKSYEFSEKSNRSSSNELSQELLLSCITLLTSHFNGDDSGKDTELLLTLLSKIVKPLFASTVSKNVRQETRFLEPESKSWKFSAPWSQDLLRWLILQYERLEIDVRKSALESQFSLLVPPILTLIDDDGIPQKKLGCDLLSGLCKNISECNSLILKRTGLANVFADALTPNLLLLPTLTPEDESLDILRSLYPAYRALFEARFSISPPEEVSPKFTAPQTKASSNQINEHQQRQAMLDTLFRRGILVGYSHASDHVKIANLLVTEMSMVIPMMGIYSAKYLQQLLPLLREILTNPMATAYSPLLFASLSTMRQLILVCWPRIRDVWWAECLRSIVGLWLALEDETPGKVAEDQDLKRELQEIALLLATVKGVDDARAEYAKLAEEQSELQALFAGC